MVRHVRSWHTVLCTRANGGIRHLALSPHSLLRATSHLAVLCANLSLSLFPLPFIRPVLLFLPSSPSSPLDPSRLHPSNPPFCCFFSCFFFPLPLFFSLSSRLSLLGREEESQGDGKYRGNRHPSSFPSPTFSYPTFASSPLPLSNSLFPSPHPPAVERH